MWRGGRSWRFTRGGGGWRASFRTGGRANLFVYRELNDPWLKGLRENPASIIAQTLPGLAQFTDEVVNRPDVQALIKRIDFGVHPDAEAAGFDKMTTIIEVELDDGTIVKGSADFGKGSPANPMSDAELTEKFRQCAAWGGLDGDRTQTVLDLAWRVESVDAIDELMRLLSRKAI